MLNRYIIIDSSQISESREMYERPERLSVRLTFYIITLIIFVAIFFSCVFKVDDYLLLNGTVVVNDSTDNNYVVQFVVDEGKRELLKEGQRVSYQFDNIGVGEGRIDYINTSRNNNSMFYYGYSSINPDNIVMNGDEAFILSPNMNVTVTAFVGKKSLIVYFCSRLI